MASGGSADGRFEDGFFVLPVGTFNDHEALRSRPQAHGTTSAVEFNHKANDGPCGKRFVYPEWKGYVFTTIR